jgi:hypothetical protein
MDQAKDKEQRYPGDLKKMEVKGWKEKMRDREQWRLVVEEAKAPTGRQATDQM